ncbi:hypothetical protein SASPL_124777 [Salvia splendens]|uniref:Uncharacterized protein n=1 Tax=Salvia splendens TaxID=180675 RepID=A0A8X8ZQ56_SALSN|nr:hypothetical protein SASPL_124777 [Salvia splendens]
MEEGDGFGLLYWYRRCRVVDKSDRGVGRFGLWRGGSFEELMDYAVEKRSATF